MTGTIALPKELYDTIDNNDSFNTKTLTQKAMELSGISDVAEPTLNRLRNRYKRHIDRVKHDVLTKEASQPGKSTNFVVNRENWDQNKGLYTSSDVLLTQAYVDQYAEKESKNQPAEKASNNDSQKQQAKSSDKIDSTKPAAKKPTKKPGKKAVEKTAASSSSNKANKQQTTKPATNKKPAKAASAQPAPKPEQAEVTETQAPARQDTPSQKLSLNDLEAATVHSINVIQQKLLCLDEIKAAISDTDIAVVDDEAKRLTAESEGLAYKLEMIKTLQSKASQ